MKIGICNFPALRLALKKHCRAESEPASFLAVPLEKALHGICMLLVKAWMADWPATPKRACFRASVAFLQYYYNRITSLKI